MKIGIDISQTAYQNTGVANYLTSLLKEIIATDKENSYVLFFSSLRNKLNPEILKLKEENNNVEIKAFKIPPTILDLIWNRLHILPIEKFIGDVDLFISSDWVEPPSEKAKKATIIYDLIACKYPTETHNKTEFNPFKMVISPNIVSSQKRKLNWVRKESDLIFCISESTKEDAVKMLGINKDRIRVIYPGV